MTTLALCRLAAAIGALAPHCRELEIDSAVWCLSRHGVDPVGLLAWYAAAVAVGVALVAWRPARVLALSLAVAGAGGLSNVWEVVRRGYALNYVHVGVELGHVDGLRFNLADVAVVGGLVAAAGVALRAFVLDRRRANR